MKWTAVLLLVPMLACGPGSRNSPGNGDDDDDNGADGGNGNGNGDGGGNNSGSGCSDAAKLIYVVDQNNNLAQFNASTKTFTALGVLNCPAGNIPDSDEQATPFSMAVDRNATAYVLYEDNAIYQVDTTQSGLPCTATGWTASSGSTLDLQEFGMGYSTNGAGSNVDTLFVAGGPDLETDDAPATATLATIDTTAWTPTMAGTVTGWPELTGNANGELWGFFPDTSGQTPVVTQIDKTTGDFVMANHYEEPSLDNGTPTAWAFGFYGGDYWVFLAVADELSGDSGPTSVYQVAGPSSTSGSPGAIVSTTPAKIGSTSLVIVGAGVSTCAPTIIQ